MKRARTIAKWAGRMAPVSILGAILFVGILAGTPGSLKALTGDCSTVTSAPVGSPCWKAPVIQDDDATLNLSGPYAAKQLSDTYGCKAPAQWPAGAIPAFVLMRNKAGNLEHVPFAAGWKAAKAGTAETVALCTR